MIETISDKLIDQVTKNNTDHKFSATGDFIGLDPCSTDTRLCIMDAYRLGYEAGEDKYKILLIKYVSHVACAEGDSFALSTEMAPCDMHDLNFTEEDVANMKKLFADVEKRRDKRHGRLGALLAEVGG